MTQTATTTPEKRNFSGCDVLFAWFSFVAGYLLCRTLPITQNPLGGLLFIVAVFTFTAVFLKRKGHAIGFRPLAALISAIVVAVSLIVSDNATLQTVAYLYALGAYGYLLYAATGNTLGSVGLLLADWCKALFILPFFSFADAELFRGMFHGRIRKGAGFALKLLIGCAVAIIPTAVVLALLSYDDGFSRLLDSLFSWYTVDPLSHIVSLLFAIPIAMYLFGLYLSCMDKKRPELLGDTHREQVRGKLAIAPLPTVLAAVIPLLFLYCVFFVSQWQYYVSGFTGVLPPFFSYATYAREGFFQLCAVSVINLAVLVAILLFGRRTPAQRITATVLTVIFSVFTLILISTALAKMVMYIRYYGLTTKRVYATWLMLVLAIVFLIVAVGRFIKPIKAAALSATVVVAAFTALSLCNVESLIARYNVDRFIEGSVEIDLYALHDLGDAAVPEIVRLGRHLEQQNEMPLADITINEAADRYDLYHRVARELLNARTRLENDRKPLSFTVNRARAKAALDEVYS